MKSITIKTLSKGQQNDSFTSKFKEERDLIRILERDVVVQRTPNVHWEDIVGLDEAKKLLKEALISKSACRFWKGVLMVGPPGTGKTMLAKAVATKWGMTFFSISASLILPSWVGKSVKVVRLLFEMVRFYAPSVIFIDDIDLLCSCRASRTKSESHQNLLAAEFLAQMDGIVHRNEKSDKMVIVLGATNLPWNVDEAFRRRLKKRIYVPLPTAEERKKLLELNMGDIKVDADVDFNDVAKNLDGYSGSDIAKVCREAAMLPMRKNIAGLQLHEIKKLTKELSNLAITAQNFDEAILNNNKSISKQDLENYDKWIKKFVPLRTVEKRKNLVERSMRNVKVDVNVDFVDVAKKLDGYSDSEIAKICRNAAMMPLRRNIVGLKLQEIKKLTKELSNLAITAQDFDEAILKTNKIEQFVSLPTAEGRRMLLELYMRNIKVDADVDFVEVAKNLDGYSSSDIAKICREAAMMPMRKKIAGLQLHEIKKLIKELSNLAITAQDFDDAIRKNIKSELK